jgi:DNA-binding transcriptional ArsR family regulator
VLALDSDTLAGLAVSLGAELPPDRLFSEPRRRATTAGGGERVSVHLRSVTTYRVDGWTALGDPTRRAIFERLADGPRAVGELASEFPVSRPAVSQHLKVLKDAGLVTSSQAGNRRIYQADPEGVAALRDQLDRFWHQALATFKGVVEQDTQGVS